MRCLLPALAGIPIGVAALAVIDASTLKLTMTVFAFRGVYDWDTLGLIAIALPVTLIFAQVSITIFKRLSDDQFRRLLIALMFVSGAVLMLREILW